MQVTVRTLFDVWRMLCLINQKRCAITEDLGGYFMIGERLALLCIKQKSKNGKPAHTMHLHGIADLHKIGCRKLFGWAILVSGCPRYCTSFGRRRTKSSFVAACAFMTESISSQFSRFMSHGWRSTRRSTVSFVESHVRLMTVTIQRLFLLRS